MSVKNYIAGISLVNNCYYCHCVFDHDRTVDHIIPKKLRGNNSAFNRLYACEDCNTMKGHLTLEQFRMKVLRMPWKDNKKSKVAYKIFQLILYRDAHLEKMMLKKEVEKAAPKFIKTEQEDIADRMSKSFPNFWT